MNYTDFIDDLAFRSKRSAAEARRDAETFIAALADALVRGEEVRLRGLGTLSVAQRAATPGHNPRTGEPIDIPAQRLAKFRPGPALKARLNPPAPAAAEKRPRKRA